MFIRRPEQDPSSDLGGKVYVCNQFECLVVFILVEFEYFLLVCCDFLSCCNYVRPVLKSENKLDSLVVAKQLEN